MRIDYKVRLNWVKFKAKKVFRSQKSLVSQSPRKSRVRDTVSSDIYTIWTVTTMNGVHLSKKGVHTMFDEFLVLVPCESI